MLERSEPAAPAPVGLARPALAQRFAAVRGHSVAIAAPLSDEDCAAQSMPDCSPSKWHLAHTTWFFETFILERFEPAFRPFHDAFRVLFNSYYNGIGDKHSRPERGLLTRPSRADVLAYRHDVDIRMLALLDATLAAEIADEIAGLVELGLQHEQQHQELLLTDVMHLLSRNPLRPAYECNAQAPDSVDSLTWHEFAAGIVTIGHDGDGFCFDNELPRHRQFVEAYALASRLVTNGEYLAFIEAGGYENPVFWLAEGWDWVRTQKLRQPLYWFRDTGHWQEFTRAGLRDLDLASPALHLSYFEASAYACFAGVRLPTEAEWEHAARTVPLAQMFGPAWQWTSSSYAPYPGFATAAGALGEYNGKFMVNQYVLRGGSLATPDGHTRASYRNFFPATARWQFSAIRLAR